MHERILKMFGELHEILENGGKILSIKNKKENELTISVQLPGKLKIQSAEIGFYFPKGDNNEN